MTYPVIGSRYSGPDFDRPCLRQMPREWVLEIDRPKQEPALWVKIVLLLWLIIGLVQIAKGVV